MLRRLLEGHATVPGAPVFTSAAGRPLTRFGIYKLVRQHAARLESATTARSRARRITPHVFRHTAAVHLLEAGVEVNVIRGWLGHVSLETTNRYAEITVRMKEAAMKLCEPTTAGLPPRKPSWRDDAALLSWLASLCRPTPGRVNGLSWAGSRSMPGGRRLDDSTACPPTRGSGRCRRTLGTARRCVLRWDPIRP